MKNVSKLTLITSVVSLIVSVIALCTICVRNASLDFDWYGVLIGILSLLVTVLIGWNIYVGIDFDKRIDRKMEIALSKIGSDVEFINDRTTYTLLVNIASIMREQTNSLLAFDMYLKAAMFASKARRIDLTNQYLENAIEIFDVMMTSPLCTRDKNTFKSKFRRLEDYIDLLKLIDSELSNSLITRIILEKQK